MVEFGYRPLREGDADKPVVVLSDGNIVMQQYRTRIWITREADRDWISEVPVEGATLGWSEWKDVMVSAESQPPISTRG